MIKAIIWDVDGVLAETEDYHRRAYNALFVELGLDVFWDRPEYATRMSTLGGAKFYEIMDWLGVPEGEREERKVELYDRKTALFTDLVCSDLQSGALPVRPGVCRLFDEAVGSGLVMGAASTSVKSAVLAMLETGLGTPRFRQFSAICAGADVERKKPAPDIYILAAARCGVLPEECVAIEDTEHGLEAALAAGMRCIATPSEFVRDKAFAGADLVAQDLDHPRVTMDWLSRL